MQSSSPEFFILIITVYLFMIFFLFYIALLRKNERAKRKEFTQRIIDQHNNIPIAITAIFSHRVKSRNMNFPKIDARENKDYSDQFITEVYMLLRFFNMLAEGIARKVYDEDLIRINYEQDIKLFYNYVRPNFPELNDFIEADERFIQIEFLLRDWKHKRVQVRRR